MTTRRSWSDLSPRARRLIVVTGAIETALKIAALVDLARRPAGAVRGSRRTWAVALTLVNSLGALPIAYFLWGRRDSAS